MYLVSACLVGVNCRYNGESTCNEHLASLMKAGMLLPVCPEVLGGLPVPRTRCEIFTGREGSEQVVDETGEDRTEAFRLGAQRTLELCRAAGISKAILQPRSPSCGCGSIYDGSFTGRLIPGNGMTARLLVENGIAIIPEEQWPNLPPDQSEPVPLPLGPQKNPSLFADTMVDMPWPEIQAAADKGAIVLLPLGIIEAHGPHMDLSADILLAHLYCRLLRKSLVDHGIQSLIAPPCYWGHADDTARYAGTFSVRPETMKSLLADIFTSLDSWGFRKVFFVNCHGDHAHIRMIEEAAAEANNTLQLQVIDLSKLNIPLENPPIFPTPREGRFEPDYHAGAIETAQMHTFFPERVNTELARTLVPQDSFHPMAYCGDPASFEREDAIIAFYKADLETDVRKMTAFLSCNCEAMTGPIGASAWTHPGMSAENQ